MLSYKKPFTEAEINYYCYIQNNFYNGYLIAEDTLLNSIDADLPTVEELVEQRRRYNEMSKIIKNKMPKISTWKMKEKYFVIDKDGSVTQWDADTFDMMKERYNVREL